MESCSVPPPVVLLRIDDGVLGRRRRWRSRLNSALADLRAGGPRHDCLAMRKICKSTPTASTGSFGGPQRHASLVQTAKDSFALTPRWRDLLRLDRPDSMRAIARNVRPRSIRQA